MCMWLSSGVSRSWARIRVWWQEHSGASSMTRTKGSRLPNTLTPPFYFNPDHYYHHPHHIPGQPRSKRICNASRSSPPSLSSWSAFSSAFSPASSWVVPSLVGWLFKQFLNHVSLLRVLPWALLFWQSEQRRSAKAEGEEVSATIFMKTKSSTQADNTNFEMMLVGEGWKERWSPLIWKSFAMNISLCILLKGGSETIDRLKLIYHPLVIPSNEYITSASFFRVDPEKAGMPPNRRVTTTVKGKNIGNIWNLSVWPNSKL